MSIINELRNPQEWEQIPFGRLVVRPKVSGYPDLDPLSVFLDEGVVQRSSREDNHNRLGEDLDKYLVVEPGDIVFNKLRTWQGGLGMSTHRGIVSPAYFVCKPNQSVNSRFLHYLLRSSVYLQELTRISKWMPPSQFDIPWEQLRDVPVLLPDVKQQNRIADYLDIETARIDSLMTRKRQLIELYAMRIRCQAIMLTTKGSHPIPLRRFLGRIKTGTTPPETELSELLGSDVAWYSPGDMGSYLEMKEPARMLSSRAIVDGWSPLFPADATLIIGIGATAGRVGHNTHESTGNQQITCIEGNKHVLPRFLSWQLWARSDEIREIAPYTTLPILNNEFLRSLPFYAPPLKTQQSIVEKLDKMADRVTLVCELLQSQIKLLNERRQALITAAVTGELGVASRY